MKIYHLIYFCIITILILAVMFGNVNAKENICLANGEWLPYFSKKLPHYGVGSRIVTEAFALEGVTVNYSFFPWKRFDSFNIGLRHLRKNGKIDQYFKELRIQQNTE